jgi:type IV fimbrial biogenesis protein FimT
MRADGFTLIELMIGIAIFAITLTYGVSSYRTWVLNNQIRNAGESISDGIMISRAEAVKCNARVAFAMGTASAWTIMHVDACGSLAASSVLESRPSSEGSRNVTVTVTPSGTNTITFGSLGTTVPNADGSAAPTRFDLSSNGTGADSSLRALRVAIGAGGSAKLCDPNIPAKTPPDPRMCY